jgi:hypothetical protein
MSEQAQDALWLRAGTAVSVLAAASLWFTLPHRVTALERAAEVHVDVDRERDEKLAQALATLEAINQRTKRIEDTLDRGAK